MPALTNPRDTAAGTWAYSTDGAAYTDFTAIIDGVADPVATKIIERMLVGGTTVLKFPSRANHGALTLTSEYSSILYAIIDAARANKTLWYLRYTWDDTGGTAGSKHVFLGYLESVTPPSTPADNKVAQFSFKLACYSYAFTAGS